MTQNGPAAPGSGRRLVLPAVAFATALVTYFLIILGSTVRVTESGMGCPGWPLCYGQLGPVDRFHSLVEQSHRYVVTLVTILVVLTVLAALRWARRDRSVTVPALTALGLIVVQIALGALTVVTHNAPFTVALHLVTGLLVLAATWVTAVTTVAARRGPGRLLGPLGWWTLAATLLLLISGSIVVDGGASYACPSWPFCTASGGDPAPLIAIQYSHRLVVLITTILLALFAMRVARGWRGVAGVRPVADVVAVLLLAQIAVGGLVATTGAPEALQDLHLALAAAIWVCVVVLASLGWQAGPDSTVPAGAAGPLGARPPGGPAPGRNMSPSTPSEES